MKHTQTAVGEHAIHNVEVISRQVSSQQLIDFLESTLATDFEQVTRHHFVEVFGGVSMMEGWGSKDHLPHGGMLAMATHRDKGRFRQKLARPASSEFTRWLSTLVLALEVTTAAAIELVRMSSNVELIWASPRELFNIFQADAIGCHIITATNDILKKLELVGRDLHEYSLETVKMFYEGAVKAGYSL